mmetsp:Transcript_60616/g.128373  ORF Transcript_60616/g.128373 Transcript_60616/m.128373 type:complete len:570 (+) Transcript_60616:110-1819(+)
MYSDFGVDFNPGDETTKVFVRRNGSDAPLKELRLPPESKLSELFEKAAKVLDLADIPQLAFFSNGVECTDLEHIEDGEVIYISLGEPYQAAGDSSHGQGLQMIGNYVIHEKLGEGGFGSVMKGVHSETGEVAAIKFVSKSGFKQISDMQRVFQEIQALQNLHHPNVVRILDVADNPQNVCFIMEFCSGGELRGYVERHALLEEEEAKVFFKQMAKAIHYVHTKHIIHRDLKLENVLLDSQNRCKIVDFGLSDYVSSKERTVTDAGTQAYLAPEVYNGSSGDADPYKIDVWGLGVILYAMAHGRLPFSRPDIETCQRLEANGGPDYREDLTAEYRRLTSATLIPDPHARYSMDAVTLDPWINSHRFADIDGDQEDAPDISFMAATSTSHMPPDFCEEEFETEAFRAGALLEGASPSSGSGDPGTSHPSGGGSNSNGNHATNNNHNQHQGHSHSTPASPLPPHPHGTPGRLRRSAGEEESTGSATSARTGKAAMSPGPHSRDAERQARRNFERSATVRQPSAKSDRERGAVRRTPSQGASLSPSRPEGPPRPRRGLGERAKTGIEPGSGRH